MKRFKQITAGLLTAVISVSSLIAASAESVTATGEQTVTYGNFEVHLNTDDTFNDGVILWNAPGSTTSDNTVVSNNRYIKFTPTENGEVSITFQGSANGSGSNKPRMYIVSGTDENCMSKNNSDSNGKSATATGANSDTTLTAVVKADTTYYIWPYCFGNANCKFTVSAISFEAKTLTPVTQIKVIYKSGDDVVAENTESIGEGHYDGDSYTYVSTAYVKDNSGKLFAVGEDYGGNISNKTLNDTNGGINKILKKDITLSEDAEVVYDVTETDAIFYDEWENLLEGGEASFSNGRYWASGGRMAAISGANEFYTVPSDGFYQITMTGGGANAGTEVFKSKTIADSASSYGGGSAILGVKGDNQYYGLCASNTVFLNEDDKLAVKNYKSSSDPLDYVVIRKIDVSMTGTTAINIGAQTQYGITSVKDISGTELTAENAVVRYTSDNPEVISVNETSGVATALKKGTANISAQITLGEEVKTETKTVTADYYSIIADVTGDRTEVDITNIVKSDNITGYTVTTADESGNKVSQYTIDKPAAGQAETKSVLPENASVIYAEYNGGVLSEIEIDNLKAGETVESKAGKSTLIWDSLGGMKPISIAECTLTDTTLTTTTRNAARVEVSPIYTYTYLAPDTSDDMLLSDSFADGDYSFEITKAPEDMYHCVYDLYINGAMIGNNVNEKGIGREFTKGDELVYTANDITVDCGSITLEKRDFYSISGVLRVEDKDKGVSKIVVTKEATIANRNTKVYIIGDSLVARYYGEPVAGYTQAGLVGTSLTGWGQVIDNFFNENIDALDLANSGQWAKGLQETAFTCVMQAANRGDYMILESGWNDVKYSTKSEMKQAVIEMVEVCEEKGVRPILVSPNCSAQTFSDGANTQYASVMREAANELKAKYSDVVFVDLAQLSYDFLSTTYGTDTDAMTSNINLGHAGTSSVTGAKGDNLHLSYLGAMQYAELVAQSMVDQGIDFINKDFSWSMEDKAGNTISVQVK